MYIDPKCSYLLSPSTSKISLPSISKKQLLPFNELSWQDFERLCLRLIQSKFEQSNCEIYGRHGQAQEGIDIYSRNSNAKYDTFQCKRYESFKKVDLKSILSKFEKGKWFNKSESFYLCTSVNLQDTNVQDEFETLHKKYKNKGVEVIKWDAVRISDELKEYPAIVYDFFGTEWVKEFNGIEFLEQILENKKLDANEIVQLRSELQNLYSEVFQQSDPGIPSSEMGELTFDIKDRFIMPNVISTKNFHRKTQEEITENEETINPDLTYNEHRNELNFEHPISIKDSISDQEVVSTKFNIDQVISNHDRVLLLGEAGSGKSTFLRFLCLDLLSENCEMIITSKNWGEALPIWLPFAYITKCLEEKLATNITSIIELWLDGYGKKTLYPLVKKALEDKRLLLLVDGIDESSSKELARLAIHKIEVQANSKVARVIYTSRPYGFEIVNKNVQHFKSYNLASFSPKQQLDFIKVWYKKWYESTKTLSGSGERQANKFYKEITRSTEYAEMIDNPLLLSVMISMKFIDSALPKDQMTAMGKITNHLIRLHPQRRKESASIIDPQFQGIEIIDIFDELAYRIQLHSYDATIKKRLAKEIIIDFLMFHYDLSKLDAINFANGLIEVGPNNAGIIIEKSSDDIAFMHRQFQEFLASRRLWNSEKNEKDSILNEYCVNPIWRYVIKYFFGHFSQMQKVEFERYLKFLERSGSDIELKYLELLRFEITLNLRTVPISISRKQNEEIQKRFLFETDPEIKDSLWHIIIKSLDNGKTLVSSFSFIQKFFPVLTKYSDNRITVLGQLKTKDLTQLQIDFLLSSLINSTGDQKLQAAKSIERHMSNDQITERIFQLLSDNNPEIVPFALRAITKSNVPEKTKEKIFTEHKDTEFPNSKLILLKLKVDLGLHDLNDLQTLIRLSTKLDHYFDSETLEILLDGWGNSNELFKICLKSVKNEDIRNQNQMLDEKMGWNILFRNYSHKHEVEQLMIDELEKEKYPFNSLDSYGGWDIISRYVKNPTVKLKKAIEKWILAQDFRDPEMFFATSLAPTEKVKQFHLNRLNRNGIVHWNMDALISNWGKDQEVLDQLRKYFLESKDSHLCAHLIDYVFENNVKEGIRFLESRLYNRELAFRNRIMIGFLRLDPDYFEKHHLIKYVKEELITLEDDPFNDLMNALYALHNTYGNNPELESFVLKHVSHKQEYYNFLNTFYSNKTEFEQIMIEPLQKSWNIRTDLREELIDKLSIGVFSNSSFRDLLSKYFFESNESIKGLAATGYFEYLCESDPDHLEKHCRESVFYRGLGNEIERRIAFCGYLMLDKLDTYFTMKSSHGEENPPFNIIYMDPGYRPSKSLSELIVKHFDRILDFITTNPKAKEHFQFKELEQLWSFYSKYIETNDSHTLDLLDFIETNFSEISNWNLLEYYFMIKPKSTLLKSKAKELIADNKNGNNFPAKVLSSSFKNDPEIKKFILEHPNFLYNDNIALCAMLAWPDEPQVKALKDGIKSSDSYNYVNADIGYIAFISDNSAEKVLKLIMKMIARQNDALYHIKKALPPFLERTKTDTKLQELIFKQFNNTRSISEKISFYSIISKCNLNNEDIEEQMKKFALDSTKDQFGFNIVSSKIDLLRNSIIEFSYFNF